MKLKYNPKNENSLEKIWNKLSSLYYTKADKYLEDQKEKASLLSHIHTALNELQVVVETNNLTNNKIIKKIPIDKEHPLGCNKVLMLENISKILLNVNPMINEFIKEENKTFNVLKNNLLSINNNLINLIINNYKILISFSGELILSKNKENKNKREINLIKLNDIFNKENKRIKNALSKILLIEDFDNNFNYLFKKNYNIRLEFNNIVLQNTYYLNGSFKEIAEESYFICKHEGVYSYKGIKLIIEGTNHTLTNVNNIENNASEDLIENHFISFINSSLKNNYKLIDLFEKIRIYISFYILKEVYSCNQLFKDDYFIYGINNDNVYRINDDMILYLNELPIEINVNELNKE